MLRPHRNPVPREMFDPSDARHLASFDVFIRTGNWGDVQFFPVLPYDDVPMTVLMAFAEHQRQVKREDKEQRSQRFELEKPQLIRTTAPSAAALSAAAQARIASGNAILQRASS